MPTRLARARLARQARRLNRGADVSLPALVLLTDDDRLADPISAAAALPLGSMVIVRARQSAHRARLAHALAPIARARKLRLLIANDPELASRTGADGAYFSEAQIRQATRWRTRRHDWLITCAAHSLTACAAAKRAGVDAVFFSPVFATESHPGRSGTGSLRALNIARVSPVPVYALGGINEGSATRLAGGLFAGLAAIGALRA